jgi:plastocyanin
VRLALTVGHICRPRPSGPTSPSPHERRAFRGGPSFAIVSVLVLLASACGSGVPPQDRPDEVLKAQLGLTDADEVHRITLRGGPSEILDPVETHVPVGAWVEFVTADGRVHEVRFENDSLVAAARAFLERTDQAASPPLVNEGERFVVSFRDAPVGRYPFLAEGNEQPAHGVVVVEPKR